MGNGAMAIEDAQKGIHTTPAIVKEVKLSNAAGMIANGAGSLNEAIAKLREVQLNLDQLDRLRDIVDDLEEAERTLSAHYESIMSLVKEVKK